MSKESYQTKYNWILQRDAYLLINIILILVGLGILFFLVTLTPIGISLLSSGIIGLLSIYIVYVKSNIEKRTDKFVNNGLEDLFFDRSDKDVYKKLIDKCETCLDIQAESLSRFYTDFKQELILLDKKEVKIRILLLDPESEMCKMREREEGTSERQNLSEKIKSQTRDYYLLHLKHLELKWYDATPSINYFRIDNKAFFGSYFVGALSRNSLTFLGSVDSVPVSYYKNHFQTVWEKFSKEVPVECHE